MNKKFLAFKVNVPVAVRDPVVVQFREKRTLQPRRQGFFFQRAIKKFSAS